MDLQEENLRLKIALASMVRQFYDQPSGGYFHQFESAGERAWNMLGLENPIITEEELCKVEDDLREKLCKIKE